MMDETCSISRGILNIISFVFPCCLRTPFTWVVSDVQMRTKIATVGQKYDFSYLKPEVDIVRVWNLRFGDEWAAEAEDNDDRWFKQ